jgi:hypothetical protein
MARPSDEAGETDGGADASGGADGDEGRPAPDSGNGRRDAVVETDGDGGVSRSTDEESPWRFGIDEVGEEDPEAVVEVDGEDLPRPPLEPESISVENALFVVLGAALTVLIIVGTL